MRWTFAVLLLSAPAWCQTPQAAAPLAPKDAEQLATRMLQLVESTAVPVPGLVHASEPLRQNGEATVAALQHSPSNPAPVYQLLSEVRAYLALADSYPRPVSFPAAADQQFAELREALQRMQRHFESMLQAQTMAAAKRDTDPAQLKRYADADSKMIPPGKAPRVVFLGDELTEAWRLNEYFNGRDFVNRGIGGQDTLQMMTRFRQDVIGLNPKAVVILAGSTDIARGYTPTQIQDSLATMAELARAHNIKPVFASLLPVNDYHKDADPANEQTKLRSPALIQQINRWIQAYCQNEGFGYIDYYSAMVDSSGQMQFDMTDDGLHPNAKGLRVMSPLLLSGVDRALTGQDSDVKKRRFGILQAK